MSTAEQPAWSSGRTIAIPGRVHDEVYSLLQAKVSPAPTAQYLISAIGSEPLLSVEMIDGDLVSIRVSGAVDSTLDEENGGSEADLAAVLSGLERLRALSYTVSLVSDDVVEASVLQTREISLLGTTGNGGGNG